jgi:hypothetical protein
VDIVEHVSRSPVAAVVVLLCVGLGVARALFADTNSVVARVTGRPFLVVLYLAGAVLSARMLVILS